MTTLLHLSQVVIDMQAELSREQHFARNTFQALRKGIVLVREALDALEKDIQTAFEERDRALSRIQGNTLQFTIEADDPLGLNKKVPDVTLPKYKKANSDEPSEKEAAE